MSEKKAEAEEGTAMGGKQQERNETDKGWREKETHKETTRLRGKKKKTKKE